MALDKDDIKQLIAILQKGLMDDSPQDVDVAPVRDVVKKTRAKKPKIKQSTNKFDSMMEANMHKEDVEIDRKLNVLPPVQRSRDYKPVKVRCRVCGRDELVNPGLAESTERYKCNKCSTSAG